MHEDEAEWNGFPGLTTQTYNSSYAEEASHTGVQPNYSVPDCQCLIFQCFVPKYFPPNLLDYVAAPISQSSPDRGPANMQLAAQASKLEVENLVAAPATELSMIDGLPLITAIEEYDYGDLSMSELCSSTLNTFASLAQLTLSFLPR